MSFLPDGWSVRYRGGGGVDIVTDRDQNHVVDAVMEERSAVPHLIILRDWHGVRCGRWRAG